MSLREMGGWEIRKIRLVPVICREFNFNAELRVFLREGRFLHGSVANYSYFLIHQNDANESETQKQCDR